MSADELLQLLEANIDSLLSERESLRQKVAQLEQDNERQRQEMIRSHEELAKWQRDYKTLETAHAMVSGENREMAKRKLTLLIQKVDKAIDMVKSES